VYRNEKPPRRLQVSAVLKELGIRRKGTGEERSTVAKADKKIKIYCDMDGVLCDFDRPLKERFGVEDTWALGDDVLWPMVNQIDGFWENLEWMPGGKELWEFIRPYKPSILTSPSRHDDRSKPGKIAWVKREIPDKKVHLIFIRAIKKRDYASQSSILIDDLPRNIEGWKKSGGIGILHENLETTLPQLEKAIKHLS